MQERLLRWFVYNLIFALIPLITVIIFRFLAGSFSVQVMQEHISEILFFALMISVVTVGEINEAMKSVNLNNTLSTLRHFFILGIVGSAILFGAVEAVSIPSINLPISFRPRLLSLSIILAVILFLVSTFAQILLARNIMSNQDDQ